DHASSRTVLERASAREPAARAAAGALARQLLAAIGCEIASHVTGIGSVVVPPVSSLSWQQAKAIAADAPLQCADASLEQQMVAAIDAARVAADTLGGSF